MIPIIYSIMTLGVSSLFPFSKEEWTKNEKWDRMSTFDLLKVVYKNLFLKIFFLLKIFIGFKIF